MERPCKRKWAIEKKFVTETLTIVMFDSDVKQIDELNISEIGKFLIQIAENVPHPLLVLDMSGIEFFGSSFIEILFRVWKRLTLKAGAHLGIAAIQPYCREVLKVTHLDSLWQIYDTQQAASDDLNESLAAS